MASFGKEFVELGLPSAPDRLIHVHDDEFRPARFDRELGGGMMTSVGRLRHDHVLPNRLKYVLLSHNTKMGAAKGAVLTAEYLVHAGYIPGRRISAARQVSRLRAKGEPGTSVQTKEGPSVAQIGLINYNLGGRTLEEVIDFAAETGFTHIEIDGTDVWKDNEGQRKPRRGQAPG